MSASGTTMRAAAQVSDILQPLPGETYSSRFTAGRAQSPPQSVQTQRKAVREYAALAFTARKSSCRA